MERTIKTVDEYIASCPTEIRDKLEEIRAAISEAAPGSIETMQYFEMPGYSYEGYDYNGMFAWFSYKAPHIRLHVRPPALENLANILKEYKTTKAILSFPANGEIPAGLVKKLVKDSIQAMKKHNE